MSESLNIHQRLAKVMEVVTYVQKEKKTGMNYTIVSHDKVTAKVRGPLLEQGIVYYPVRCVTRQEGNRTHADMTIRFVNIDEPDDFFEVETFGYGVDSQDKGPGKAMSYAVKYALLKALGLETGDDPDLDQGSSSDYIDPAVIEVQQFKADISRMGTLEDLEALLAKHTDPLAKVGDIDPALLATVRQGYAKRRKELAAALSNQEG
jgi:ERF superfamily